MIGIMNRCLDWQSSEKRILQLTGRAGMELMVPYVRKLEKETEECGGDEKIMLEAKEEIRNKIIEEIRTLELQKGLF